MTHAQWLIEHLIMWKTSNVCEEHESLELYAYKKVYIFIFCCGPGTQGGSWPPYF
jgi:hypothetical protein